MDNLRDFFIQNRGSIIGVIVAIIVIALKLYNFILAIILIVAGAILGNYIQYNKEEVKNKIKNIIDKM